MSESTGVKDQNGVDIKVGDTIQYECEYNGKTVESEVYKSKSGAFKVKTKVTVSFYGERVIKYYSLRTLKNKIILKK